MNEETYRDKLNDIQLEVESLRAKLKEAQTGDLISRAAAIDALRLIPCDLGKRELEDAIKAVEQLPSAQPEIVRCKDCKHFHYDMPYVIQGFPVLGHEVCDFWGDGCKTSENGFCSYAERITDE